MDGMDPRDIAQLKAAVKDNPKMRARDLAEEIGASEGQLVAAYVGEHVTRLVVDFDRLFPGLTALGEVMALTRNESCVIEKVGVYDGYRGGAHAALVVNEEIDLRMFPSQWKHGFAVVEDTEKGPKRSLQFFDAAGDAVHKIWLRPASDIAAFDALVADLIHDDQAPGMSVSPRKPPQAAKGDPARAEELRTAWDQMSDTHQFLQMVRKLKMTRLGAYRIAGAPYAEKLDPGIMPQLLQMAADGDVPIMVFVGNMGCIEIHTGEVKRIVEMGPWINVLDPGFDLHLRNDHVKEVWAVKKSTRAGDAISVELFGGDGLVIAQVFGVLRRDGIEKWNQLVADLPRATTEEIA